MTARFVALWPRPDEDVEGFEKHYRETHNPIAESWPKVRSTQVTRAAVNPFGGDPAYHLVLVAEWESPEDRQEAMDSEEMKAALGDLQTISERWGIRPDVILGDDL